MVFIVENTHVKQVTADNAVIIAVSHGAVFGAKDGEVYGAGVAFPLLQAVHTVNQRLLKGNPSESVLFDVMLITTNRDQQQQSERVCSSTRHYGLQIHRFCFSSEDDFTDSLIQNKVNLFLTTDRNEATQAANKGVFSALLDRHTASSPSEQLRVMFCGDAILDPNSSGNQQAAQVHGGFLGSSGSNAAEVRSSRQPSEHCAANGSRRQKLLHQLLTISASQGRQRGRGLLFGRGTQGTHDVSATTSLPAQRPRRVMSSGHMINHSKNKLNTLTGHFIR